MAPYLAEWPWSPLPMLPEIGAIMLRGTLDTVVDIKERLDWRRCVRETLEELCVIHPGNMIGAHSHG
jgi:hypothetical protein